MGFGPTMELKSLCTIRSALYPYRNLPVDSAEEAKRIPGGDSPPGGHRLLTAADLVHLIVPRRIRRAGRAVNRYVRLAITGVGSYSRRV